MCVGVFTLKVERKVKTEAFKDIEKGILLIFDKR